VPRAARDPALTIADLIKLVPGPDFPTAGMIYGIQGVVRPTTRSWPHLRARRTNVEPIDDRGREAIIITELPISGEQAAIGASRLARRSSTASATCANESGQGRHARRDQELSGGELSDVVLNKSI